MTLCWKRMGPTIGKSLRTGMLTGPKPLTVSTVPSIFWNSNSLMPNPNR